MGFCCCFSCFGSGDNDGEPTAKETEMQAKETAKSMAISVNMSAPSVKSGTRTSGVGLALAGVAIEQDAAYWEWHIELPPRTHVDTILFGVTAKKDRKFYKALEDKIQGEEGKTRNDDRITGLVVYDSWCCCVSGGVWN
jgi:hypothetical protein